MKIAMGCVLLLCALECFGASNPYAKMDDPRPNGRMTLRELSLCEPPEDRRDWCMYPHEIRTFIAARDQCDYLRSEPFPEGDTQDARARRKQLTTAMRKHCKGTDRRLADLRKRYRHDAVISKLLAAFDARVEP